MTISIGPTRSQAEHFFSNIVQVQHIKTLFYGSSNSHLQLVQRVRPPTPGIYLRSPASSPENSPASSPWGSPRSSPSSSPEPGYGSPDQTGVPPSRSSTPHPDMPGVEWFPRQEGSEMTRLPADITQVLAPRPSRATTTADEDDEPSITELCVSYIQECAILKYPKSLDAIMLSYNPGQTLSSVFQLNV